jgi:hypothetical protein
MNSKFHTSFLLGIFVFFLTGCGLSIPNAKPLVDSSIELEKSNEASFQAVEDISATIMENLDSKDSNKAYEEAIKKIKTEASVRQAFLSEVVDYSIALQNVIKNTESENKKIQDFANSIDSFLNGVEKEAPLAGPYAPEVIAAIKVGKPLNQLISMGRQDVNKIRTASSLEAAVEQAGPLFIEIAKIFKGDLSSLSKSLVYAPEALIATLWSKNNTYKEYRVGLLNARIKTIEKMRQSCLIGKGGDVQCTYDQAVSDGVWGGKKNFEILQSIDRQLEQSKPIFTQLDAQVTDSVSKVTLTKQLISKTNETLDAFGKAHTDFAQGLKDGTSVDFSRLEEYGKQLQTLREQLKTATTSK